MIPIHREPDATAEQIESLLISHTERLQDTFNRQLADALETMSNRVQVLLASTERDGQTLH